MREYYLSQENKTNAPLHTRKTEKYFPLILKYSLNNHELYFAVVVLNSSDAYNERFIVIVYLFVTNLTTFLSPSAISPEREINTNSNYNSVYINYW